MKQPHPLHAWWVARPVRERRTLLWGAGVVAVALLWGLWLQPSWQQAQRLPNQLLQAKAQWLGVSQLAQQANGLQASATTANALSRSQAQALARSLSAQALNAPSLSWQESADAVTIRFGLGDAAQAGQASGLTPAQLAQWLQAMRLQARLQPRQLQLQRQAGTGLWQGDITFSGPPLLSP